MLRMPETPNSPNYPFHCCDIRLSVLSAFLGLRFCSQNFRVKLKMEVKFWVFHIFGFFLNLLRIQSPKKPACNFHTFLWADILLQEKNAKVLLFFSIYKTYYKCMNIQVLFCVASCTHVEFPAWFIILKCLDISIRERQFSCPLLYIIF